MTSSILLNGVSLKDVESFLKETTDDSTLDAFGHVLGFAIAVSPLLFGQAGLIALPLIEVKDELVSGLNQVVRRLKNTEPETFQNRLRRMQVLHCLTVYVALGKGVATTQDDLRRILSVETLTQLGPATTAPKEEPDEDELHDEPSDRPNKTCSIEDEPLLSKSLVDIKFDLPHPANGSAYPSMLRERLFDRVASGIGSSIYSHIGPLEGDDQRPIAIDETLARFASICEDIYRLELIDLSVNYEELYLWIFHSDMMEATRSLIESNSAISAHVDEMSNRLDLADRSFSRFSRLAETLPSTLRAAVIDEVLTDLHLIAEAEVGRPVVEDATHPRDSEQAPHHELQFCSKRRAYIPQAYKVIRYTSSRTRLEHEDTWRNVPESDDLGSFVLRYLLSIHSIRKPLLVLGHPGSGKSLFTQMLVAGMAPPYFNAIRVELRNVDPDMEIQALVERSIYKQTGHEVNWVHLSRSLDSPPVLIFDGFDELLQATGQVNRSFLSKILRFQQRELDARRPVRTIVTSRLTLMDRAEVPTESTIIRLSDFDAKRQNQWIELWNELNSGYYGAMSSEGFSLEGTSQEVRELAKQPLLLLMLAIHDATDGSLSAQQAIDETQLYESLLDGFVRRELNKGENSAVAELDTDRVAQLVEGQLEQLSILAIGMFNRRRLASTRDEVALDLSHLGPGSKVDRGDGQRLSMADLVLGSFFFIHESRNVVGDSDASSTSTFEFLHNTFGEYLAARYIVQQVVSIIAREQQLRALRNNRWSESAEEWTFDHRWFAGTSYCPVHDRPHVLRMAKSRLAPALAEVPSLDRATFETLLGSLVIHELETIANGSRVPWGQEESGSPYPELSLGERLGVYASNVVALAIALKNGASFDLPSILWQAIAAVLRLAFDDDTLLRFIRHVQVTDRAALSTSLGTGDSGFQTYAASPWAKQAAVSLALADLDRYVYSLELAVIREEFPVIDLRGLSGFGRRSIRRLSPDFWNQLLAHLNPRAISLPERQRLYRARAGTQPPRARLMRWAAARYVDISRRGAWGVRRAVGDQMPTVWRSITQFGPDSIDTDPLVWPPFPRGRGLPRGAREADVDLREQLLGLLPILEIDTIDLDADLREILQISSVIGRESLMNSLLKRHRQTVLGDSLVAGVGVRSGRERGTELVDRIVASGSDWPLSELADFPEFSFDVAMLLLPSAPGLAAPLLRSSMPTTGSGIFARGYLTYYLLTCFHRGVLDGRQLLQERLAALDVAVAAGRLSVVRSVFSADLGVGATGWPRALVDAAEWLVEDANDLS